MGSGVNLAGIPLANPVLLASGTCGYGEELADLIDLSTIGGLITKAVTVEPRLGNPVPRVYETPAGMLNAIGLANPGLDVFVRDKLPYLRTCGTRIIVNVAGSTVEDYVKVIERLERETGIDGYELNISCPNVKEGGIAFGADPRLVDTVVRAAVSASRRPVIVKLSPNVSDITVTARAAEAAGAAALSLINTLIGMAIDLHRRRPVLANGTGGLSGPAIKPVGLAMVYRTYRAVRIPIIGLGGIMTATDALEYLMAGAVAVQIGTGTFIEPATAPRVATGIAEWMASQRLTDLGQVTGACHR